MTPAELRSTAERAVEAVTGGLIAQAEAARARVGWRGWRAIWARLQGEPLPQRMVVVCMYCERFRCDTGEWLAPPPGLVPLLHDPSIVQVTHGACPICLAGHLDERPG